MEQKRQLLTKRRESLLQFFADAATARKQKRTATLARKIANTNEWLNTLDRIEVELQPKSGSGIPRFAVSSLFLHESFRKLTADQDEQFFFITGTEINGTLVLDQWAEFAHQKRSLVGVTADSRSTHRLLIKLEQFGHKLLAHFHSHPGLGADSTRPSGIDTKFQDKLENAGHLAVMAIFSRDGFIRFVRLDEKFEIQIYGEGVENHEPNVYRLTNIDPS
jgi:proteasome lid subunit RPN8/RPN11